MYRAVWRVPLQVVMMVFMALTALQCVPLIVHRAGVHRMVIHVHLVVQMVFMAPNALRLVLKIVKTANVISMIMLALMVVSLVTMTLPVPRLVQGTVWIIYARGMTGPVQGSVLMVTMVTSALMNVHRNVSLTNV